MSKETRRILLDIANLSAYLALGIALWELFRNALAIGLYFVLIIFVITFLRLREKSKEVTTLKREIEESARAKKEAEFLAALVDGMLGLYLYTTEPPVEDPHHRYTLDEEEIIIQGEDGIFNWHLQGVNVSGTASHSLVLKVSGDSPTDIATMGVSVVDKRTGERFPQDHIKVVKDYPYMKVFELVFPKPTFRTLTTEKLD